MKNYFKYFFSKLKEKFKLSSKHEEYYHSNPNDHVSRNNTLSVDDFFIYLNMLKKSGLDKYKYPGVYIIKNLELERFYIGQSTRVFHRIKSHFSRGCSGGNSDVYADWSRLNHRFEIQIINYPEEDLIKREKDLINDYVSRNYNMYNIPNSYPQIKKNYPFITDYQNKEIKDLLCKNFKICNEHNLGKDYSTLKIVNKIKMDDGNNEIKINIDGMLEKNEIKENWAKELINTLKNFNLNLIDGRKLMSDESSLFYIELIPRQENNYIDLDKYDFIIEDKNINLNEYKIDSENYWKEKRVGRNCLKCNGELVYKERKKDKKIFIGCHNYPDCKYSEDFQRSKMLSEKCPISGDNLIIRKNKENGGEFIGCSGFPNCQYLLPIKDYEKTKNEIIYKAM